MGLKWSFQSKTSITRETTNERHTSFNDLNNDLLLEIFDYLSFTDILLSFGNLDTRFNTLIENYPQVIDLRLHQICPSHIRSLKINGIYQLPVFFSFRYTQLSSLRAITLGNLRPQEILDVLTYVPLKQLEYIYFGICAFNGNSDTKKLITFAQTQIITLGQYQLRQCHFKEKLCILIDDLPETLSSLEYLEIVACRDFSFLSQLLLRMPHLQFIQTSILDTTENLLVSNVCQITHLSLKPHANCSPNELSIFLKTCCPYLKKLIIQLYILRSEQPSLLINKQQWTTILPYLLTSFHWRSIPNPSIHPMKTKSDRPKLPLRDKIWLTFSDLQAHFCVVIIDAALITAWIKT